MKPRRVATPWHLLPASARIMHQPVGVVGIISPWNYPVQLALAPCRRGARRRQPRDAEAVGADAGNVVAARASSCPRRFATTSSPSSKATPRSATRSRRCRSITCSSPARRRRPQRRPGGGAQPDAGDARARRQVAGARRRRRGHRDGRARLIVGKLLNAGQTCIAPDYALVPAARLDEFVAAVATSVSHAVSGRGAIRDYTSIVNPRPPRRLQALLDDARRQGCAHRDARRPVGERGATPRRLAPTLVAGVTDDMAIMREEIFGPLLPIETYSTPDDAIARINARPHPLALYWFGARPPASRTRCCARRSPAA